MLKNSRARTPSATLHRANPRATARAATAVINPRNVNRTRGPGMMSPSLERVAEFRFGLDEIHSAAPTGVDETAVAGHSARPVSLEALSSVEFRVPHGRGRRARAAAGDQLRPAVDRRRGRGSAGST